MRGALEHIETSQMIPRDYVKQWREARDYFESDPNRLDVYRAKVPVEHRMRYNSMHSTLAISAAKFFVSQKVSEEERRQFRQDFENFFHRFYFRAYGKPAIKLKKRD